MMDQSIRLPVRPAEQYLVHFTDQNRAATIYPMLDASLVRYNVRQQRISLAS